MGYRAGVLLGVAVVFLAGCLQTRAELSTRRNYQSNQTQVAQAQQQKSGAFDTNSRLGDIEESLRILIGRFEEMDHRLTQMDKKVSEGSQGLEQDPIIQDLQKKTSLLLEELKGQRDEIAELKALQATASGSAPGAAGKPKDSWTLANEHFEARDYRRAILNFQKYREQNPKGTKLSEATYKIGFCFEQLGMKDEARTFYNEVIEKYPKSSDASKARVRVSKLK